MVKRYQEVTHNLVCYDVAEFRLVFSTPDTPLNINGGKNDSQQKTFVLVVEKYLS